MTGSAARDGRPRFRALVVDDELPAQTAEGRATRAIVQELQDRRIDVVEAESAEDGISVVVSDAVFNAMLLDWTLGRDIDHMRAKRLLEFIRSRNEKIPIFLMRDGTYWVQCLSGLFQEPRGRDERIEFIGGTA